MQLKTLISVAIMMAFVTGRSPAQEQWVPYGPPPWTSTSVMTTGGITYFLHSATLEVCRKIETGAVGRSGTNISFTAEERVWTGYCSFCFECYHTQTGATVLGNLVPGGYRLSIYSYSLGSPSPSLWRVSDFQVPAQTETTLEIAGSTNQITVSVRGVPAASYVLQSSSDLQNWTNVRTNQGGPCTFTNAISAGKAQFFRVRVTSGSLN